MRSVGRSQRIATSTDPPLPPLPHLGIWDPTRSRSVELSTSTTSGQPTSSTAVCCQTPRPHVARSMSSASPSVFSTPRTNARRTCQLCRKRKTRCELPNPEVDDSERPLSSDLSCPRCLNLSAACIVDDRGILKYKPTKRLKRKRSEGPDQTDLRHREDPLTTPQQLRSSHDGHNDGARDGATDTGVIASEDQADITQAVRGIASFEPYQQSRADDGTHSNVSAVGGISSSRGLDTDKGIRYHGRPLTITERMVQLAYLQRPGEGSALLSKVLSDDTRKAVEREYPQLLLFCPSLPSIATVFDDASRGPSPENVFLLYLVAYLLLARSDLPSDLSNTLSWALLRKEMYTLRDVILRSLQSSETSFHIFMLLSTFSPFGSLPAATVDSPMDIRRQRGVDLLLDALVARLDLPGHEVSIPLIDHGVAFQSQQLWMWLGQTCLSMSNQLEEDVPDTSTDSEKAIAIATDLLNDATLWTPLLSRTAEPHEYARVLGNAAICEQIMRSHCVLTGTRRAIGVLGELEGLDIPTALQKLKDTFGFVKAALEDVDDQLGVFVDMGIDTLHPLVQSWFGYRSVCYNHNRGKIERTAIRVLVAAAYLEGSSLGTLYHDLPTSSDVQGRASRALAHSTLPSSVEKVFRARPPPPSLLLMTAVVEQRVTTIGEVLSPLGQLESTALIPWHRATGIFVDIVNVVMEMQAGTLAFGDINASDIRKHFRLHRWTEVHRTISAIATRLRAADKPPEPVDGSCIGDICATMVESMLRVMSDRVRRFNEATRHVNLNGSASKSITPSNDGPGEAVSSHAEISSGLQTGEPNLLSSGVFDDGLGFDSDALDQLFAQIFNTSYQ